MTSENFHYMLIHPTEYFLAFEIHENQKEQFSDHVYYFANHKVATYNETIEAFTQTGIPLNVHYFQLEYEELEASLDIIFNILNKKVARFKFDGDTSYRYFLSKELFDENGIIERYKYNGKHMDAFQP